MRLFRSWNDRNARKKSILRKAGQYTSAKYSSAYAICHSKKLLIRSSPDVRKIKSGSGRLAV